ncbi:MAG: xylose isomerase, partial [Acidimicrobiia bacterium]|nr:xylose isomerase [Acidimicrobiia bacterium]
MTDFFDTVPEPVAFAGRRAGLGQLAYRVYDPDRQVMGRRMEDHLRIAVCYWHSFNWPGSDIFGHGTFDRPWLDPGQDPMAAARAKQDAAFEFFEKLGTPFFCFHDVDMAPEGADLSESRANLDTMVERAAEKMEATGVRLLWGTANLFSHSRYAAGAATNPNPEVFTHAAAQVRHMLEATHRLDGANYV